MSAEAATKTNGAANEESQQTVQPLFFSEPFPINPDRHSQAGLRKDVGMSFARNTNSVILNLDDIPEAARSYPIVFSNENNIPRPVAVLGLSDKNSFVNEAGVWDPMHYIPSYIRRYPFGLAPLPNSEELALCIDEGAPHYTSEGADFPLFEDGKPTQLTQDALQFCGRFQKMNDDTIAFGKAIKEADLLHLQSLEIQSKDGNKRNFNNLQLIHKDRWHNFAKTNANEWEQKGYLALVIMILASQANWKYLAARS